MVGVEERAGDDLPRGAPLKIFIIDENPHEFRDGKGWVCL